MGMEMLFTLNYSGSNHIREETSMSFELLRSLTQTEDKQATTWQRRSF